MKFESALALGIAILHVSLPICLGQGDDTMTIRVESREVRVPARVIQSRQYMEWQWDHEVGGLSAKNSHIFEDGKEQQLKSVAVQNLPIAGIKDNRYSHVEAYCTPRGIWSSQDETPDLTNILWSGESGNYISPLFVDAPRGPCPGGPYDSCQNHLRYRYLLSYVPPPSAEGTCHRVKVKLAHVDAKVDPCPPGTDCGLRRLYARDIYCNVVHPASDPLLEQQKGNQLFSYLNSPTENNLVLKAQVGWFFVGTDARRLYLSSDLPFKDFASRWNGWDWNADINVLGLLYRSDGSLLGRFSDNACEVAGRLLGSTLKMSSSPAQKQALKYILPERYQMQLDVAPGTYNLKLAITDGKKFGRLEIPVQVDSYDRNSLAISSLILSDRF